MQIALGVKVPQVYTMIDVDEDKSSIDTLVDDKGTDLAIEADFEFSPTFTKDRTALVTTLRAKGTPATSAREFTVQGMLSVTTARGHSSSRASKVAVTKGTASRPEVPRIWSKRWRPRMKMHT